MNAEIIAPEAARYFRGVVKGDLKRLVRRTRDSEQASKALSRLYSAEATSPVQAENSRTIASIRNLFFDPETGVPDKEFCEFMTVLARDLSKQAASTEKIEAVYEKFQTTIGTILAPEASAMRFLFRDPRQVNLVQDQTKEAMHISKGSQYGPDTFRLSVLEIGEEPKKFDFIVTFAKNAPGDKTYNAVTEIEYDGLKISADALRNIEKGTTFVQKLIEERNKTMS